jgi:septal ring factor EnvC (AmiA/AmiB activator)
VETVRAALNERERRIEELSSLNQKEAAKLEQTVKELSESLRQAQEQLTDSKRKNKEKDSVLAALKEQMEVEQGDYFSISKKNGEL